MSNVTKNLVEAAKTFEKKNKEYGNAYKTHGDVLHALFPDGITLQTADDCARFSILNAAIAKLNRYCKNYEKGGHQDSLHDMIVFIAMLEDYDENR